MSGITASIPIISVSGNIRPASSTKISSAISIIYIFLATSSTPPRGVMRIFEVSFLALFSLEFTSLIILFLFFSTLIFFLFMELLFLF